MPEQIDMGLIRSLDIRPDEQDDQMLAMLLMLETGDRVRYRVSREALRGLWSFLTQILYPRAADQLTKRMATVVHHKDGVPSDVTFAMDANPDPVDPDKIVIGGLTVDTYWTMKLDRDMGENLWASLEDHLNQV